MSGLEIAAVVFGLACVYPTIRQSVLCWPAGLIQVLLYIAIFYEVKLYSDMLLQVVYVGLQIYGWYYWIHGGKSMTNFLSAGFPEKPSAFESFPFVLQPCCWDSSCTKNGCCAA